MKKGGMMTTILATGLLIGVLFTMEYKIGIKDNKSLSDVEKVLYSVVSADEIVKVTEEANTDNKKVKDIEIVLNLDKVSKTIVYDESLRMTTTILNSLHSVLSDEIANYTILVNTTTIDIYGNEQKVKALKIEVSKDILDKINFDNFDYKNLDKICPVTKFKYLTDNELDKKADDTSTENKSESNQDNSKNIEKEDTKVENEK